MRILNDKSDSKLNTVSIFLTKTEALHMVGYLEQLIEGEGGDHSHLMSEDFDKEINICLYDPKNIANFHPRVQKLIKQDE